MDDKQTDAEESRQERYLRLADLSGWVLLLGLFIEFVDAAFSGKAFSEIIWILVADAFVVAGVFGELQFARWAKKSGDKISLEMKSRLVSALDRSSKAEIELAKLQTRRVLSAAQMTELASKAAKFAERAITVTTSLRTLESAELANQIAFTLGQAGMTASRQDNWAVFNPGAGEGIGVCFAPAVEKSVVCAEAIAQALSEIGLDAAPHPFFTGGGPSGPTADWVLVIVGEMTQQDRERAVAAWEG
jgi:hypothetical protein